MLISKGLCEQKVMNMKEWKVFVAPIIPCSFRRPHRKKVPTFKGRRKNIYNTLRYQKHKLAHYKIHNIKLPCLYNHANLSIYLSIHLSIPYPAYPYKIFSRSLSIYHLRYHLNHHPSIHLSFFPHTRPISQRTNRYLSIHAHISPYTFPLKKGKRKKEKAGDPFSLFSSILPLWFSSCPELAFEKQQSQEWWMDG